MAPLPIRVLIGVMVACIVLIVAVVTLVITISIAETSLQNLAEEYSFAVLRLTTSNAAEFVDVPRRAVTTIQTMMSQPGHRLPQDDPNPDWCARHKDIYISEVVSSNYSVFLLALVFDDGSRIAALSTRPDIASDNYRFHCHGAYGKEANDGVLVFTGYDIYFQNNIENRLYPGDDKNETDTRGAGYHYVRSIINSTKVGLWGSLSLYIQTGRNRPTVIQTMYSIIAGAFNSSGHFMGMATSGLNPKHISDFLKTAVTLPRTAAFAIDSDQRVIGATTPEPFERIIFTSDRNVPEGCILQHRTATYFGANNFSAVCFDTAATYPNAALNAVAHDTELLTVQGETLKKLDVGGETYFVLSGSVYSQFRGLGINILFTMPEDVATGDITTGRNIAIGCTVALVIIASIVSFILVLLFLRPLNMLARQMHETARLRTEDVDPEEVEYSNLAEINAIQRSYVNMNNAIHSFTRYVPKDVVTDLMRSGQLCEIKMESMKVTALFTDIQGFTTICERVPPEPLSRLVSLYFDRMSKIVMQHEGVIDKFIGDCIMAVWGAPFPVSNQEIKAVLCGVLLNRETLVEPCAGAFDEAGEVLGIRVGLSTGNVLAGNMGSSERMSYTVIGDSVNLAARLESMNKQFGNRVMISEETKAGLMTSVFKLRLLLSVAVVGKAQPVQIFDVVGFYPQPVNEDERAALQANDDAEKKRKASDVNSEVSFVASKKSDDDDRASRYRVFDTTLEMINAARALTEKSLVITELERTIANVCSEAAAALLKRDFGKCMEEIEAARKLLAVPAEERNALRTNVNVEKSLEVLQSVAEKALVNSESFKGYYEATDK